MEIAKHYVNYMTRSDWERIIYPKRADNVKIVNQPISGMVYVCPYPPSHFHDLEADARRLRLQKNGT